VSRIYGVRPPGERDAVIAAGSRGGAQGMRFPEEAIVFSDDGGHTWKDDAQ
jgi:hypothetical protein